MVSAKQVINSTKAKVRKQPKGHKTPLGEIGYDNVRDDIERVKKMREGSVEKVPALNNDIANKKYVDDNKYTDTEAVSAVATADDYLLNTGDSSTSNYNLTGTLHLGGYGGPPAHVYLDGYQIHVAYDMVFDGGAGQTITGLSSMSADYFAGSLQVATGKNIELKDNSEIRLGTGTDAIIDYDGNDLVINPAAVGSGTVVILNLPVADPSVAGGLWNDGGTLKVSVG